MSSNKKKELPLVSVVSMAARDRKSFSVHLLSDFAKLFICWFQSLPLEKVTGTGYSQGVWWVKRKLLKTQSFSLIFSMVLHRDSWAFLTRITVHFHPVESGLLCNLPEYNLSIWIFLASASLHNHWLSSQMLSHFDKWMLKTTLPSSDFIEGWHKKRCILDSL